MLGEIVVGQVSKSRIRARCDESARPDFAKTNLLLMKEEEEEEGEDGGEGDNEDVQEDVEKKILKGPEIFHWSFELTAAGQFSQGAVEICFALVVHQSSHRMR